MLTFSEILCKYHYHFNSPQDFALFRYIQIKYIIPNIILKLTLNIITISSSLVIYCFYVLSYFLLITPIVLILSLYHFLFKQHLISLYRIKLNLNYLNIPYSYLILASNPFSKLFIAFLISINMARSYQYSNNTLRRILDISYTILGCYKVFFYLFQIFHLKSDQECSIITFKKY